MGEPRQVRILGSISEVAREAWDALLDERASPFVSWAWLEALEHSECAAPDNGWTPRHLTLWRGGQLVAAAPAYLRSDSDGDFSRDFHWAAAAQRGGLRYYPKLILAVPFTPATGRRLLVAHDEDRQSCIAELLGAAREVANEEGCSSIHVLFPDSGESDEIEAQGWAGRIDFQFHWQNRGYREPGDFLARFPSKRRAMLRRERAAPAHQGITVRTVRGEELRAAASDWADQAFALHAATLEKLMWGRGWLNRAFYRRIFATLSEHVEVVEARRNGKLIAGAFNVSSDQRLYGRYWGCFEEHPFLHFNVCLYHSIDDCIQRGLSVFEGGAGGEHKILRGFEPTPTHSAHFFLDPRLDRPLRAHLKSEAAERRAALARFQAESPIFKASTVPSLPDVQP
jgi:predicted N-acyltransferase